MNKLELIIFDWDGTLVDSLGYIVECLIKASEDVNLPPPSRDAIRRCIGLSATRSLDALFPGLENAKLQQVMDRYRLHFFKDNEKVVQLFEGTKEVLSQLKQMNYTLAVATAKSRRGLNGELDATHLTDLFTTTRTVDEAPSKPNPQMLLDIMQECDVDPSRTLMIGDTAYDMEMANNAKTHACAVTYGAHSKDTIAAANPHFYINEIAELIPLIEQLKESKNDQ